MRYLIITILMLSQSTCALAQTFNVTNRFGLANLIFEDCASYQNNYYFAGYGNDSISSLVGRLVLVKTSNSGVPVFNKTYQPDSNYYYYSTRNSILFDSNKVLLYGSAYSNATNYRPMVVVTDTNGNLINSKIFADTTLYLEAVKTAIKTSDNGYLLVGRFFTLTNQGNAFCIKIDSNLNEEWRQYYGTDSYHEIGTSVLEIQNKSYIVGGMRSWGQNSQTFVYQLDQYGNKLKEYYAPNTQTGEAYDIAYLPDSSGFVYCGYNMTFWYPNAGSKTEGIYVAAIDTGLSSNKWIVNNRDTTPSGVLYDLEVLSDGIIVVGNNYGQSQKHKNTYPNMGVVLKLDYLGNILSYSYFEGLESANSFESESYLYGLDVDDEDNILAAGYSVGNGPITGWMLKLDSAGCLNDSCPVKGNLVYAKPKLVVNDSNERFLAHETKFSLGYFDTYPELIESSVVLSNDTLKYELVYDISGVWQPFESTRNDTFKIDSFPPGNYTVEVKSYVKDTTDTNSADITLKETDYLSFKVVGIGENVMLSEVEADISIHPNPFTTHLKINSKTKIKEIDIYNLLGEKVFSQTYPKANLNLEFLPNGIYLLKLETNEGISTQKIAKY